MSVKSSRIARYASMAALLAFSFGNFPVQAANITVDGNLADLISKVNSTILNAASGTDPMGSADSPVTESNNGFDIQNVYAYYDWSVDVLYLGMNVYGNVGDSQPVTNTTATNEGFSFCATTYCNRSIFDSNETYGIQLYLGTSIADPQLLSFNVLGADNGTDSIVGLNNPWSLVINRAISEANDGVEYSIGGLYGSGQLVNFPGQDVLIRFTAGSGDTNATSAAAEDYYNMQMQLVPVPAAIWLFGSGLLGVAAVARRRGKKHN